MRFPSVDSVASAVGPGDQLVSESIIDVMMQVPIVTRDRSVEKRDSAVKIWNVSSSSSSSSSTELSLPRRPLVSLSSDKMRYEKEKAEFKFFFSKTYGSSCDFLNELNRCK